MAAGFPHPQTRFRVDTGPLASGFLEPSVRNLAPLGLFQPSGELAESASVCGVCPFRVDEVTREGRTDPQIRDEGSGLEWPSGRTTLLEAPRAGLMRSIILRYGPQSL